ncbi:hypothetical protein [Halomonas cupida]|uniref:hypothetical protein n=1 Tax=Halomonas cupida TaxID=44933 RepID=UPI003A95A35D
MKILRRLSARHSSKRPAHQAPERLLIMPETLEIPASSPPTWYWMMSSPQGITASGDNSATGLAELGRLPPTVSRCLVLPPNAVSRVRLHPPRGIKRQEWPLLVGDHLNQSMDGLLIEPLPQTGRAPLTRSSDTLCLLVVEHQALQNWQQQLAALDITLTHWMPAFMALPSAPPGQVSTMGWGDQMMLKWQTLDDSANAREDNHTASAMSHKAPDEHWLCWPARGHVADCPLPPDINEWPRYPASSDELNEPLERLALLARHLPVALPRWPTSTSDRHFSFAWASALLPSDSISRWSACACLALGIGHLLLSLLPAPEASTDTTQHQSRDLFLGAEPSADQANARLRQRREAMLLLAERQQNIDSWLAFLVTDLELPPPTGMSVDGQQLRLTWRHDDLTTDNGTPPSSTLASLADVTSQNEYLVARLDLTITPREATP